MQPQTRATVKCALSGTPAGCEGKDQVIVELHQQSGTVDQSQYFVCSQAPSGSISATVVYIPAVGSRAHNDIVFIK